jgi:phosphoribosyl 1,2-cyclic phosphodiesterase
LAECRELDELRRACSRDVEKYPGYADDGCELFTAEQFESLLNERVPIHAQECTR